MDLGGDPFDYVYQVKDRKDGYSNFAVQVPLMIGVQHKKFYMLAGVKVGYNLVSKTHTSALITTYGAYIETPNIYNAPEYQFFTDLPKNFTNTAQFAKLTMDLSLEMGGRIGFLTFDKGFDVPKRPIEYRLAGFVDYGLLDMHVPGAQAALITPTSYDINPSSPGYVYKGTSMVDNLKMNDVMSTAGFARSVNNLTIGIKFTVLFQLPKAGACLLCTDNYYQGSINVGNGGGGMKYEE